MGIFVSKNFVQNKYNLVESNKNLHPSANGTILPQNRGQTQKLHTITKTVGLSLSLGSQVCL